MATKHANFISSYLTHYREVLVRTLTIVLLILLALTVFFILSRGVQLSPVTGRITEKNHYPMSSPVYNWTPWAYELVVTETNGQAAYTVRVSEEIFDEVYVGEYVERNRPFVQEE